MPPFRSIPGVKPWRQKGLSVLSPQIVRLVPIEERFNHCTTEDDSMDKLRNRLLDQLDAISIKKKKVRFLRHLREHVRVRPNLLLMVRIPKSKLYPSGPATIHEPFRCKLTQNENGKESPQDMSVTPIPALVKLDHKLQDSAILAQSIFGHFYEGQCYGIAPSEIIWKANVLVPL